MAEYKSDTNKCRICRAVGEKLFLKGERCFSPKCPVTRKGAVPPGQHGAKRKRRPSEYGIRLKEAKKVKKTYGVTERDLKKIFKEARKVSQSTGEAFLQILESRLDNLVYRLGFSPSRRLARQLVSHKHVLVNGKPVNIPSYRVKLGQIISLDGKALAIAEVKKKISEKDSTIPTWLEKKAAVGKLSRIPKRDEIEISVDEQLIVEYYSRQ